MIMLTCVYICQHGTYLCHQYMQHNYVDTYHYYLTGWTNHVAVINTCKSKVMERHSCLLWYYLLCVVGLSFYAVGLLLYDVVPSLCAVGLLLYAVVQSLYMLWVFHKTYMLWVCYYMLWVCYYMLWVCYYMLWVFYYMLWLRHYYDFFFMITLLYYEWCGNSFLPYHDAVKLRIQE